MGHKENEEFSKLVQWIAHNKGVWDFICDSYIFELTYQSYIEMLTKLVENNEITFAALVVMKAKNNIIVEKAILDTITTELEAREIQENGIFTLLLENIKKGVIESNVTTEEMPLL